jgi:hypothetical protein
VSRFGVAAGACVSDRLGTMGLMTSQARQPAGTLLETGALAQVDGLMPDVPRIAPVGVLAFLRGLPVATATEPVHAFAIQVAGLEDIEF